MTPELETQLRTCTTLPSPPHVAARVIDLARDPDVSMEKIAEIVRLDPAMVSKILRVANSPLYASRRRCENVRQALVTLGLQATMTLILSFSLVTSLRRDQAARMDYTIYWQRVVLAAAFGQALAAELPSENSEQVFLASLLQDIGMLALDKAMPSLYRELNSSIQTNHEQLQAYERDRVGTDHAEIGAWLLKSWNLPEPLQLAVKSSHRSEKALLDNNAPASARCVALAGRLADFWLDKASDRIEQELKLAEMLLPLSREDLGRVLTSVGNQLPETEAALFDRSILDADLAGSILEQAHEILTLRNLQALQEAESLRETAVSLETRAQQLEEKSRLDGLTGTYNRGYLDQMLRDEFALAKKNGWPISIVFVDLDHFKKVNDTYGHQSGDRVLRNAGRLLRATTRDSDSVARYGGEEFVLVLPGTDMNGAKIVAQRVLEAFRQTSYEFIPGPRVTVTASVGVASQSASTPFDGVEDFVRAADQSVYSAKLNGRNRIVCYEAQLRGLSNAN